MLGKVQTGIAFFLCGYSCFTSSESETEILLPHVTTWLALKSWLKCQVDSNSLEHDDIHFEYVWTAISEKKRRPLLRTH